MENWRCCFASEKSRFTLFSPSTVRRPMFYLERNMGHPPPEFLRLPLRFVSISCGRPEVFSLSLAQQSSPAQQGVSYIYSVSNPGCNHNPSLLVAAFLFPFRNLGFSLLNRSEPWRRLGLGAVLRRMEDAAGSSFSSAPTSRSST